MRTTRVGSATVRPSSDHTIERPSTPRPWPPKCLRHVDLVEPEFLAAGDQRLFDVGLELLLALDQRSAFERNEFFIDEPPHHVLQHCELVGEVELHVHLHGWVQGRQASGRFEPAALGYRERFRA